MSSVSRVRILIVALATVMDIVSVTASVRAAEGAGGKPSEPSETRASGNWTDPPARTNAAAPSPAATPARIEEPAPSMRAAKRPVRRSAKPRRPEIRQAASRPRVERQVRIAKPARRVIATPVPPRAVAPPRQASRTFQGGRPVYGFIEPDAPAAAYYARRRFGTVGSGPAGLGLPPGGAVSVRPVRMDGPTMHRQGSTAPFGYWISTPLPPDDFEAE